MKNSIHLRFAKWLTSPRVKLSVSQSIILSSAPVRQVDISKCLGISGAGVSSAVDSMVQRGLVTRNESPNDRRVVHIERTPLGDALAQELQEIFGESGPVISVPAEAPAVEETSTETAAPETAPTEAPALAQA